MCCLFGFYDYGHSLSAKQKSRLVSALAVAAEAEEQMRPGSPI